MVQLIFMLLKFAFDWVTYLIIAIVRWMVEIYKWYKDQKRLELLEEDKNRLAITVKEKLDTGDYRVVNCLFDQKKEEFVDNQVQVYDTKKLDDELKAQFGNKDMLILR
jgi:predicted membrane protein